MLIVFAADAATTQQTGTGTANSAQDEGSGMQLTNNTPNNTNQLLSTSGKTSIERWTFDVHEH